MNDCGYQDVECWVRQLHAAGWEAVAFRRGGPVVVPMGTTWRSPTGLLYRGPYLAWTVMNDADSERSNDVLTGAEHLPDAIASVKNARWTLDNIYTIARRRVKSLQCNRQDTDALVASECAAWGHVQRLCEKAGCQSRGVLRDNGGSV